MSASITPTEGPAGWGVLIRLGVLALAQERPVGVERDGGEVASAAYDSVDVQPSGIRGTAVIRLGADCRLEVVDEWRAERGVVRLRRTASVRGSDDRGFGTTVTLSPDAVGGWTEVEPFVPGVTYGNAPRVAERALAGWPARVSGVTTCLIREDRMAAPVFALRYPDGRWVAVLHANPDGATTAADGAAENGGETIVDRRLRFASLGGRQDGDRLTLGICFPGTEGEHTYSSGGLPLQQLPAWRRRYSPAEDGLVQQYDVAFRAGTASAPTEYIRDVWRWAWDEFRPVARPVDIDGVVEDCTRVLAEQVTSVGDRTGIALEADAVNPVRTDEDTSAVMGFVGANTDAGFLLLRVGAATPGKTGQVYRALGEQVLDTFSRLPLTPPAGEGFDTASGGYTTYRTYAGRPAVYARAVAEGCLAVLDAWREERRRGTNRPAWLEWARSGGEWLLSQQEPSGALPRAWAAGTGEVLDPSDSAPYVIVPFLVALSDATGDARYRGGAVRAAEYGWDAAGRNAAYAGATLDNPDVVDKEAAILSAEGFLDLFDATGDAVWLERADAAASVAETWICIWDVPMPEDADEASLHWKPRVSTVGHQLITTGCSMTDGFLAVNASVFARLFRATGDDHWLAVARLVTHGTTTMLAREDRAFDLRGPGWQQEHWSFAPVRGRGLNRRWLPWVPVAHVRGIHRVEDLGDELAALVLGGDER